MRGVRAMAALWGLLAPSLASAQPIDPDPDPATEERLEGLTVERIAISAPPREDDDSLIALSGLREGVTFRAAEVRRAVKLLYQLGRFENVLVLARRVGNLVELRLSVVPRAHVREITVLGETVLGTDRVIAALGLPQGSPLDIGSFAKRRGALADELERVGYRSPAIGLAVRDADANGGAEVVVRIDAGPVTRVRNVSIDGPQTIGRWILEDRLGVGPGDVLDMVEVKEGLDRVHELYRRRGHADVVIQEPEIVRVGDSSAPAADLEIRIDPGPVVQVHLLGSSVVPRGRLLDAIDPLAADTSDAAIAEVQEVIAGLLERRGYWSARVDTSVQVSPDRSLKIIAFKMTAGIRARVVETTFPGNTAVDEELLRDKVVQLVEQSLGDALTEVRVDSRAVSSLFGDRSILPAPQLGVPEAEELDAEDVYIQRAYRTAADALADLYRAEGYQTVEIEAPKVETLREGRALKVTFSVSQGVQWRLGAVSVSGNDIMSTGELLDVSALTPGAPLSFYEVDTARRAMEQHYRDRGYLYAKVDEDLRPVTRRGAVSDGGLVRTATVAPIDVRTLCNRAAAARRKACDVELAFRVHEGPEVRARRVVMRGNDTTIPRLITDELLVEEGAVLTEPSMERTERNLSRLGVFRRVSVAPMDGEAEAAAKDVLVELKERKHSAFEIGAGVSTEEGVRVFASYSHGNLFGAALRAQVTGKVNYQVFFPLFNESVKNFIAEQPIEYEFGIGMALPRVVGAPRGFGLGLDIIALHDNDPAFSEDTQKVTLTASYKGFEPEILGARRPLAVRLRASLDQSEVLCNEDLEGVRQLCGEEAADITRRASERTFYASVLPSVSWDLRDDALTPRAGVYAEVQPEFLKGLNDASPDHVSLKTKINGYIPIADEASIAMSLIFWRVWPLESDGQSIPVNRRLFAGGRSTIRGFREQTLFPIDKLGSAEEVSPGGLLLAAFKTELRFPIAGALSGTVFHDIGDLFDDPSNFALDKIRRESVGVGVRYATPIGPLLLDIALTRIRGEIAVAPHFAAVGSF